VEIVLNYKLSGAELLIFGTNALTGDRKVTLTGNSAKGRGQSHPSEFMWRILSRLQVIFKVKFLFVYCECCARSPGLLTPIIIIIILPKYRILSHRPGI